MVILSNLVKIKNDEHLIWINMTGYFWRQKRSKEQIIHENKIYVVETLDVQKLYPY